MFKTYFSKINNYSSKNEHSFFQPANAVFSGFGGFNKKQQSSFDFLANLTNGSNNTNGSASTSNSDNNEITSLASMKPLNTQGAFTNSGGLFSPQTITSPSMPLQTSIATSPFAASMKTSPSSVFTPTNTDTASNETPFKNNPVSSSINIDSTMSTAQTSSNPFGLVSTSTNDSKSLFTPTNSTSNKMQSVSSNTTAKAQSSFGVSAPAVTSVTPEKKSEENDKSNEKKIKYFSKLKGLNEAVSDWISKHVAQTPLCILSPIFKDYEKYLQEITDEHQSGDKDEQVQKMDSTKTSILTNNIKSSAFDNQETPSPFTSKLANDTQVSFDTVSAPLKAPDTKSSSFGNNNIGVSTLTSSQSKQDINASTPFGISSGSTNTNSADVKTSTPFGNNTAESPFNSSSNKDTKTSSPFEIKNTASTLFTYSAHNQDTKLNTPFAKSNTTLNSSPSSSPLFDAKNNFQMTPENKQPAFSFGTKASPNNDAATSTSSSGFSFGVTATNTTTTSPFAIPIISTNKTTTAPFSFGVGEPFSFSANNIQQPSAEATATEKEDEEPPKVEYTPVKEDNSVYEKKCKIFVKKDGNFVDKGVGTLYIKKIEGNVKHQLLVRANTNLGTVLLNLVLAEAIPTQRMGKNNVMLVCIPTPDAKPPPTPVLIRVKTGEEADELLESLNKYKA